MSQSSSQDGVLRVAVRRVAARVMRALDRRRAQIDRGGQVPTALPAPRRSDGPAA